MKEHPIIMSGNHPKLILDGTKTMTRRVIKPQPHRSWDEKPYLIEASGQWCFHGHDGWGYKKCPYGRVGDRLWVRETWATDKLLDYLPPRLLEGAGALPFWYLADSDQHSIIQQGKWRPSIFMPRWASRILLEITEVRVERVQDISEEDAIAEGTIRYPVKIKAGWTYRALEDYEYKAYPLRYWFKKGTLLRADFPSLGHARLYAMDDRIGDKLVIMNPKEAFSLLEDPNMSYVEAYQGLWDSLNAKRGCSWEVNPWVWVISFKKC